MSKADIAIVTILPEEYAAVVDRLRAENCVLSHDFDANPNQCGWRIGEIADVQGRRFQITVAMAALPHQTAMASVIGATVRRYKPRYVILSGIAGGFPLDGLTHGDVVVSSVIWDYEYGVIDNQFRPRMDFVYPVDGSLLRSSASLNAVDKSWATFDLNKRPLSGQPKLLQGPIASGNKVVKEAVQGFFAKVLEKWPKIVAVEMEGAGAAAAIQDANESGETVGFLMVRGISDMPRTKKDLPGDDSTNSAERDRWKQYAACVASNFIVHWIKNAWPVAPARAELPAITSDESGTPTVPPPDETIGRLEPCEKQPAQSFDALNESSIWIGFQQASKPLFNWPTDLGKNDWLHRPEYESLRQIVTNAPHSTTLLLGAPGSGKSALLAKFGNEIHSQGIHVLAIKADVLANTVKDVMSLADHLGLPDDAATCVRFLAASNRVLLLIDQLDALASIVDLSTARLNVLLNLVRELSGIPNVHIVCSCREFERRRDARLAAIDAEVLQLELPAWGQVSELLQNRGIHFTGWPRGMQELLRAPQNLKIFLRGVSDPSNPQLFHSREQMLDNLWDGRVTNANGLPGREELLTEIATQIANRESFWIPLALFPGKADTIDYLIVAGILSKSSSGTAIGFSHQTLFEHARSRTFALQVGTLAKHVQQRQDGLFVRAALWAGLNYLHGADQPAFRREFGLLWNNSQLRAHLRHMLVEFLGQISNPDIQEQLWLSEALNDPKLRTRALASVRGNAGWFSFIARKHLPALMRDPGENGGLISAVLASALPFAKEACLNLLREEWARHPERDSLTWHAMNSLNEWDQDSVELVCAIVERCILPRAVVVHLAVHVSESQPKLAPKIIGAALQHAMKNIEQGASSNGASQTHEGDSSRPGQHKWDMRRILDSSPEWDGAEVIAQRAPKEFLDEIWPIIIKLLDYVALESCAHRSGFRVEFCSGFDLGPAEEIPYPCPLPEAVDVAICTLASTSPAEFSTFFVANKGRDSLVTQRLLARGLAASCPTFAKAALDFLLEDTRRFRLGPHENEFRETIQLLSALVPHLDLERTGRIESAILKWNPYQCQEEEESAKTRHELLKYARRDRLRLLGAMPPECLTPATRSLLGQEERAFPDHETVGIHNVQVEFIGSPMSAVQMEKAINDDIIRLFEELVDQTGHSHPRHLMQGGCDQAALEFQTFAQNRPQRAVEILTRFEPSRQERAAGRALVGIAKSDFPDAEFHELILRMDARGFRTDEFRIDVACALEERLNGRLGLPDSMVEVLERWLGEPWTTDDQPRAIGKDDHSSRPESVLWGDGGMTSIPYSKFHLLYVLTYGYLMRSPPEAVRWLAMLEAHVERDTSAGDWEVLCADLKYLSHCDPLRASMFLDRLFVRFPALLTTRRGIVLLAKCWGFCNLDQVWSWLERVRTSAWEKARQAYGELVALRACLFPEDVKAKQSVDALLGFGVDHPDTVAGECIGVALAAANLWNDARSREFATGCLVRLIAIADDRCASAILSVFRNRDDLLADTATQRLLSALAENSAVLKQLADGWILEQLANLLPNEALSVAKICHDIVRLCGNEMSSIASRWALHAANLTSIAITLHRMDTPFREHGLSLFEALLDLHLPDAQTALLEIDQRLQSPIPGLMPRPPRTRRRRLKK